MRCQHHLQLALALGAVLSCRPGPPRCTASSIDDFDVLTAMPVYLDAPPETAAVHLRRDLEQTLVRMWGSVDIKDGAPPPGATGVWISTSNAARSRVPTVSDKGFGFRRDGDQIVVWAATAVKLQWASFALLEELGARFFHPMQDFVPQFGEIRLPKALEIAREPAFDLRGLQLHLLHPTEYLYAFNGTGGQDRQVALRLIDWLVKTGQNHLQWPIMSTMPFDAWSDHIRPVIDYAHERGVTVGVNPILFGKSSLQNNFILASERSTWQSDLESNLDRLLALPFDHIELTLGEFLAEDFEYVLQLLNHATAYALSAKPGVEVSVVNHVGNYENLFKEFRGERTYFYFLPGQADAHLTNTVHTVFFYDLYRDWGMYGHEDFSGHREFLLGELGERKLRYKPESSYWVTADVDVPLFLPEYIRARWTDINRLHQDTTRRGHRLDGHVLFSSGHEWNYWLTDYLTARHLWQPTAPLSEGIEHYASAFGACGPEVATQLTKVMDLQTEVLFDGRLIGHMSGEDLHDDLSRVLGFSTHPLPRTYESLVGTPPAERARFASTVVRELERYAETIEPSAKTLETMAAEADTESAIWLRELADGVRITELRARHSANLYQAVLARLDNEGDLARAKLQDAAALRARAEVVVQRRALDYRFDLERLTGAYDNPTIYHFGYLRQAHTLCYWRRPALQAEAIVQGLQPILTTELPKCLD